MAHHEFSLQLAIPKERNIRPSRQIRYHCHNSDGLEHCDCITVRKDRGPEGCCFYGRPIEPLAFYLPPYSEVGQQVQSPLYGVLPKEIRYLIFEFALADDGALAPDCDNLFRRECGTDDDVAESDVACTLLQTCRAVYQEAYRLPMQVNGKEVLQQRNPRTGTSEFDVRMVDFRLSKTINHIATMVARVQISNALHQ